MIMKAIDYVRHRADVNPERLIPASRARRVNNVPAAVGHCVGCANMRYADRAGIRAISSTQRFILSSSIATR